MTTSRLIAEVTDPPSLKPEARDFAGPRIAVLVPCYNEEAAIARSCADFRAALPDAAIYVYDNNSTRPRPSRGAREAGAVVRTERARARAMWCAACSPTSRPTSMCWWMATTPMTPAPRRAMVDAADRGGRSIF